MATIVGKSPQHVKRCTCRKCASIIEYTENEVVEVKEYDYGGGCDLVGKLRCPSCGYEINVS